MNYETTEKETDIQTYDIIPDIHADHGRLALTLDALGYRQGGGTWEHPEGRIAAFLGDFIDRGSQNRAVIETVRAMVEGGTALAIMGNHELNALHYHGRGENRHRTGDGYMRAHTEKHARQHASFLAEYPLGDPATRDVLDWFLTLPVFLELEGFRLVHACWESGAIVDVQQRRPDGRLDPADLEEIALEETRFAKAVDTLLKGPEVQLPDGYSFEDNDGALRREVRVKWWASEGASWRDATLSVPDPSRLPEGPISDLSGIRFYGADEPPVFFGHYKRAGRPAALDTGNVMCLDYLDEPCAYRWAGAPPIDIADVMCAGTGEPAQVGAAP